MKGFIVNCFITVGIENVKFMDMKNICKNCVRWYGTPERSYLAARSYSADCGNPDPNYSCKAFTKRKPL